VKSPSASESSSSSIVKGFRSFLWSDLSSCSAFDVLFSEFCLLCNARRAASWRRAREGGILSGGGGGGAEGGSRSVDEVAVVVDGVEMYREN
jgi:hypothetical protein